MEGYDFTNIRDKKCVLSFWAKATKIGKYYVQFQNETTRDLAWVASYEFTQADVWKKVEIPVDFSLQDGTWGEEETLGLEIKWILDIGPDNETSQFGSWISGASVGVTELAGSDQVAFMNETSNDLHLTQIMLTVQGEDKSGVFRRTGGSYANELKLCERYYEKSYQVEVPVGTADTSAIGAIINIDSIAGTLRYDVRFKTRKRASASVEVYSTDTGAIDMIRNASGGSDISGGTVMESESGYTVSYTSVAGQQFEHNYSAESEL